MSCLWPGWGTRCMNYLPVYCFAWLCIDSSLPITSSSSSGGGSSGSMSTNNPLRRHALLPPDKPEEGWGQEKKKKSKPSPSCSQLISSPPFQPLTAHVPLLFVVLAIFPVLLSSISPPHSSCTCLLVLPHSLLQFNLCYKHLGQGHHITVDQLISLFSVVLLCDLAWAGCYGIPQWHIFPHICLYSHSRRRVGISVREQFERSA